MELRRPFRRQLGDRPEAIIESLDAVQLAQFEHVADGLGPPVGTAFLFHPVRALVRRRCRAMSGNL